MSKIYYGKRASGKTVRLIRQAEAMEDAGKIPVFICAHKSYEVDVIKPQAEQIGIDTKNWEFIDVPSIKAGMPVPRGDRYCYFVDKLQYFVSQLLSANNGNFFATISEEECKEVHRSNWDKHYFENS